MPVESPLTLDLDLRGRVAIVTGASRRQGIGAAICQALAHLGADIAFSHWQAYDRDQPYGADQDGPPALRRTLESLGVRVADLEVDLSQPESAEYLLDGVQNALGAPCILVNNATYSVPDSFEDLDVETLDRTYAVTFRAGALLSLAFARRFQGTDGRIVNLSSGQSLGPMPTELAYASMKGAVEAFTVSLAAAIAAKGITVNAVDPGATQSGWISAEQEREWASQMAFGRVGLPADAARLIAFLCTPAAGWITGQIIHSRGA